MFTVIDAKFELRVRKLGDVIPSDNFSEQLENTHAVIEGVSKLEV